ncbi:MAG: VOC family protein [Myxococcales bacterium]|nr:VOC family protein [Myxococcales bacterium]
MTIRNGFSTVTPYLVTDDLDGLLAFMRHALGAEETLRARGSGGGVHVELRVGDSMLMVGGASRRASAMLFLYVDDPDAWHARALQAGATSTMAPADTTDGERRAGVKDAFGNDWWFGRPQ